MSIIEYGNDSKTGRNLSTAAVTLLLVTGTTVPYANTNKNFGETGFKTAFTKKMTSLTFDLQQSTIVEYGAVESSPYINEEEVNVAFKMPPVKRYKRKATISKRVHASPKVEISGLV